VDNRENFKEVDDVLFVEVESEPELEGPVKIVGELMQDNEGFADDHQCAVQQKRKAVRSRGTFKQQSIRRRRSLVRNQGLCFC